MGEKEITLKFCVSVCELNPLHNGHQKLIRLMKSQGDAVVLIMSGGFCQRGEIAVLDKYTRAKHAIKAGADVVLELPSVFASSPAEMFAKGAIKLLGSLPGEKTLFFGAEKPDKLAFLKTAEALQAETKEFKKALKEELATGSPYAKAREIALSKTSVGVDLSMLNSPNCILGLEYVKAIKFFGYDMDIEPILRDGGFNDLSLEGEFCSAGAIRKAIEEGKRKKIKPFVPDFVYHDLPNSLPSHEIEVIFSAIKASAKELKEVTDCTEGLENRIKVLARSSLSLEDLLSRLETKRYTCARLSRILTNNMLGITRELTEKCLKSNLYLKVLAVNEEKKDVLSVLSQSRNAIITRKADADRLSGTAETCFFKDVLSNDIYNLCSGKKTNEYDMKTVSLKAENEKSKKAKKA